jgi:hypothetical protein
LFFLFICHFVSQMDPNRLRLINEDEIELIENDEGEINRIFRINKK